MGEEPLPPMHPTELLAYRAMQAFLALVLFAAFGLLVFGSFVK